MMCNTIFRWKFSDKLRGSGIEGMETASDVFSQLLLVTKTYYLLLTNENSHAPVKKGYQRYAPIFFSDLFWCILYITQQYESEAI